MAAASPTTFELHPARPFRLDLTVWTLRRQPHNAMDRWDGDRYRRTLALGGGAIEACVRQAQPARTASLQVELRGAASTDARVTEEAYASLRRLLGLDAAFDDFYALARGDAELEPLAQRYRGMRPPRYPTLFEALTNAIACQQVSLHVGILILNRLGEHYGCRYGETFAFPQADDLVAADPQDLRALGLSFAKARTLIHVANLCSTGDLSESDLLALAETDARSRLTALPGIGRWSAEYALLRGLGRLHVFPGDDVGAHRHLAQWLDLAGPMDYDRVMAALHRWRDYGGLIYLHLLLQRLWLAGHVDAA